MDGRLKQQLEFVLEIDKEKNIFRQTHLSGQGRNENAAGILQRAGGYRTGDADVPDTRYRGDRCRRYLCI